MSAEQPIGRDLVRWTYRLLLGREPESERVLSDWSAAPDFTALREGILDSPEFTANAVQGFHARGGWVHGPVSEAAAAAMLRLRDGAVPDAAAVAAARAAAPDLPALRRMLLDAPEITRRLPPLPGPRMPSLHAGGCSFGLRVPSDHPAMHCFPAEAPALAALMQAALPGGGEGAVLLDQGAGIGLALLGLAAGAPGHALLAGFEPDLSDCALLAAHIAQNGLERARALAVALEDPAAWLAAEGLDRLDVLRIGGRGAGARLEAWAPWLARRGVLVVMTLDLRELLGSGEGHPEAALARWCAAFADAAALPVGADPYALDDAAARQRAVLAALERPDRRITLVLGPDGGWRGRFSLL